MIKVIQFTFFKLLSCVHLLSNLIYYTDINLLLSDITGTEITSLPEPYGEITDIFVYRENVFFISIVYF